MPGAWSVKFQSRQNFEKMDAFVERALKKQKFLCKKKSENQYFAFQEALKT